MDDLLAKPFGGKPITLEAHTKHVVSEARNLLRARPFWGQKYNGITGKDLESQVVRAAEFHDKGKAHEIWQSACQKDREHFLKTGVKEGEYLRRCGLRHEFASLWWAKNNGKDLTLAEKAAIAAHHGKLSYQHSHRWENDGDGAFKAIWKDFQKVDYRLNEEKDELKEVLLNRYKIAGVRSLLQLADHRASRKEAGGKLPPINQSFDYSFAYKTKRPVQKAVVEHSDKQEMILRAPTGSGKTDAALLWAKYQIENGYADRLVIAMPTRFTSTSLDMDVSENVSETGLYHSSAWFARYRNDQQQNKSFALEVFKLARLLMMPATVSTIDHLLMSLTGTQEDHHSIFFNLMNSCVVIDEADFYDEFVQANITKLLEVLRVFNIRILIMSATVPESAKELYEIDQLIDPYFSSNSKEGRKVSKKKRCQIINEGTVENIENISDVLHSILDQQRPTAIIYANTVNRALEYYDWFLERNAEPILYHSRFTEPDKKRIEEGLISALGKDTWNRENAKGIAILTQIGEMSLNISAPVMVSDLCPMDRLAQRAGRLSRFEEMEPGNLHIVTPVKDEKIYPAPYGEYNREEKEWVPGNALLQTKDMLKDGAYSANDFVQTVNKLYPENKPFGGRASVNKDELDKMLYNNWLINPASETDDNDFETQEWRSRDIPSQRMVLTQEPYDFNSFNKYREFELEFGVSCPVWQIETGKRLKRVTEGKFMVGDEEVVRACSTYYSPTEGLILNKNRERSNRDQFL
ncbi:MAG TPA: CRISPR-associated helicase Cas3' [Balneolaceae bacterium]|nr:CRISPR-associated helicase Cas3' [Balneolaceae bacterium]